jgi:hypothetical protein
MMIFGLTTISPGKVRRIMYITPVTTASGVRTSTCVCPIILFAGLRQSEAIPKCRYTKASVLNAEWSMSQPP